MKWMKILLLVPATLAILSFCLYKGTYWITEIKVSDRQIEHICGVEGEDSWQNLVIQLQNEILTGRRKSRAVIYECLEGHVCGGFGDRFRGIVNLFVKGVLQGRAFFIKHEAPVTMEHILLPKNIWWNVSKIDSFHNLNDQGNLKSYVNSFPILNTPDVLISPEFLHKLGFDANQSDHRLDNEEGLNFHDDIIQANTNGEFQPGVWFDVLDAAEQNRKTMSDPLLFKIIKAFRTMKPEYTHACVLNFLFAPAPKVVALLEATIVSMMTKHQLKPFADRIYDGIPLPDEDMQFPWSHVGTGELNIIPTSNFFKTPISVTEYWPRVTLTDHWRENVADEVLSMMNLTRNTIPPIIGIHFRISGRTKREGMSFQDTGQEKARFDPDSLPLVLECADRLKSLMHLSERNPRYILLSDDMNFRKDAVEKYDNVMSPPLEDLPYHIAYPDKPDPDGRRTAETLNELLLLSFSEAVVYTRSGFGQYAARFGMIPLNRIVEILEDLICPI